MLYSDTVVLDGKTLAGKIEQEIASSVKDLPREPMLAIVTSGVDEASKVYVRNKVESAKRCGIKTIVCSLREDSTTEDFQRIVGELSDMRHIDGIIVQLPLPEQVNEREVIEWIHPYKDVDGLTYSSMIARGKDDETAFWPCTPMGIIRLLDDYNVPIEGKHAVIIGRSNLVGRPLSDLLLHRNATVTICHSKTEDLGNITKTADILVSAAGVAHLVKRDMVKEGAAVVDVGINSVDVVDEHGVTSKTKAITGDVDLFDVYDKVNFITPVPGGVGPMTVAMLMENTLKASQFRQSLGTKTDKRGL